MGSHVVLDTKNRAGREILLGPYLEPKPVKMRSKNGSKIGPSKDEPNEPQGLQRGATIEPKGCPNTGQKPIQNRDQNETCFGHQKRGFWRGKTCAIYGTVIILKVFGRLQT